MTAYKCDCHKCTNEYVQGEERWCKPMVDGRKPLYIESGDCGKNFVFNCKEYTVEPRQMEMYPGGRRKI